MRLSRSTLSVSASLTTADTDGALPASTRRTPRGAGRSSRSRGSSGRSYPDHATGMPGRPEDTPRPGPCLCPAPPTTGKPCDLHRPEYAPGLRHRPAGRRGLVPGPAKCQGWALPSQGPWKPNHTLAS
jgi:hypothetical protein